MFEPLYEYDDGEAKPTVVAVPTAKPNVLMDLIFVPLLRGICKEIFC
jgi:hypothetical protein